MKRNDRVIEDFLKGKPSKNRNLYSNGTRLVNYNTCIAEWHDGSLILNVTKYSRTTTVIQNELLMQSRHINQLARLDDVPINTQKLGRRFPYIRAQERALYDVADVLDDNLRSYLEKVCSRMNESNYEEIEEKVYRHIDKFRSTARARAERNEVQDHAFYLR